MAAFVYGQLEDCFFASGDTANARAAGERVLLLCNAGHIHKIKTFHGHINSWRTRPRTDPTAVGFDWRHWSTVAFWGHWHVIILLFLGCLMADSARTYAGGKGHRHVDQQGTRRRVDREEFTVLA